MWRTWPADIPVHSSPTSCGYRDPSSSTMSRPSIGEPRSCSPVRSRPSHGGEMPDRPQGCFEAIGAILTAVRVGTVNAPISDFAAPFRGSLHLLPGCAAGRQHERDRPEAEASSIGEGTQPAAAGFMSGSARNATRTGLTGCPCPEPSALQRASLVHRRVATGGSARQKSIRSGPVPLILQPRTG